MAANSAMLAATTTTTADIFMRIALPLFRALDLPDRVSRTLSFKYRVKNKTLLLFRGFGARLDKS